MMNIHYISEIKPKTSSDVCKDLIMEELRNCPETLVADLELQKLVDIYKEKVKEKKSLEKELSILKEHICSKIEDKTQLVSSDGELLATYKWSKPVCKFNKELFEKQMPGMYEKYVVEGDPVRSFLVK